VKIESGPARPYLLLSSRGVPLEWQLKNVHSGFRDPSIYGEVTRSIYAIGKAVPGVTMAHGRNGHWCSSASRRYNTA